MSDDQSPDDPTAILGSGAHGPSLDRAQLPAAPDPGFAERYEPSELLGSGGMGEVHLARDRRIGRSVAMKRLHATRQAGDADRFLREVALQGRLEHPSVVPVYDAGVGPDGSPYFTMKRVSGTTLAEILERLAAGDERTRSDFPPHRLVGIVAQIAATVDYAHSRGVLHRDLKPANVMVGEFGEVYVLDWGIAGAGTLSGDLAPAPSPGGSDATTVGGTYGYAAPEQLFPGPEPLGPGSDVWSLGAMLFECVTGQRLRPAGGAPVPERRRPSERRADLDVPPELDDVCARALAPTPADRYPSMREMHLELERFVHGKRDQELRRRLAAEHVERAGHAAALAVERPGEESLAARRDALREIGRALGLDPGHAGALEVFARLLSTPPAFVPPEVEQTVELDRRESQRRGMTYAAVSSALGLVGTMLFFVWAGVRETVPAVAVIALTWLAAIVAFLGSRPGRGRRPELYAFAILSILNFGFLSRIGGPLVFVPVLYLGLAITLAGVEDARDRTALIALTVLGFLAPLALELSGVLPTSYVFEDDRMTILPQAVPLRSTTSIAGLTFVALFSLGPAAVVARTRDRLGHELRQRALNAWQLRQMVDPDTEVDPMMRTRLDSTLW